MGIFPRPLPGIFSFKYMQSKVPGFEGFTLCVPRHKLNVTAEV